MRTLTNYREVSNPPSLELELSTGETMTIRPKATSRERRYQNFLELAAAYRTNPGAKQVLDSFLNNKF